jgi:hypothetical protein
MTSPSAELSDLTVVLRARLEQTSDLIFARDLGVVDLFWQGGKFWLFGSAGEQFLTREELLSQLQAFFAKPYRERFVFGDMHVDRHGDMAWANASTVLEVHHPDRVVRMPYRLFALFQQVEGDWRWRVFSGSEPAANAYEATTGVNPSLTTG